MQVTIDFQLNRRFGVTERIVFGMVMHGFTNAREIYLALPIFSDAVIAEAIRNLVNRQIINADVSTGALALSDCIMALIEVCLDKCIDIEVPDSLKDIVIQEGLVIRSERWIREDSSNIKKVILQELLPGVRIDSLQNSLDFVIRKSQGEANE